MQGDPIAVAVYALGFVALQEKICLHNTGAMHVAYANNLIEAGKVKALRK